MQPLGQRAAPRLDTGEVEEEHVNRDRKAAGTNAGEARAEELSVEKPQQTARRGNTAHWKKPCER